MKMSRLLLLAVCALPGAAFAQTAVYGVRAGSNFSSLTTKIDGAKSTSHMLAGVAAGVYADLEVAPEWIVEPSLMYEGKGGSDEEEGYRVRTRLHYLTLPVDLLYRAASPGSGAWTAGLGPYFGYGLKGKLSGGPENARVSGDPFKTGGGSLTRFDFGGDVRVGYETASGFQVGISAELGVLNLAKHGNSGYATRNTSFDILIGYRFGQP